MSLPEFRLKQWMDQEYLWPVLLQCKDQKYEWKKGNGANYNKDFNHFFQSKIAFTDVCFAYFCSFCETHIPEQPTR